MSIGHGYTIRKVSEVCYNIQGYKLNEFGSWLRIMDLLDYVNGYYHKWSVFKKKQEVYAVDKCMMCEVNPVEENSDGSVANVVPGVGPVCTDCLIKMVEQDYSF